jgi:hypothetical protein
MGKLTHKRDTKMGGLAAQLCVTHSAMRPCKERPPRIHTGSPHLHMGIGPKKMHMGTPRLQMVFVCIW